MSRLTGKRRYREQKRLFRRSLLVLQVEFHDTCWSGGFVEPCLSWRDATVEDLMTIAATHRPFHIEGHVYVDQPL
jgi:hypothetical protein